MSAFEAVNAAITNLGGDTRFFSEYWDKRHGFVSAGESGFVGAGAMVDELSHFLDRTDIRYPSLRLVKDGIEVPINEYTRELRLGNHTSHDWIVNEQAFAYYNSGSTIILQMLQHSVPNFGAASNALERRFEANVQLSSFITPPEAQGFTAHYDTYSFFAIQLFGSKRWSLYDNTPQLPVRDDRDEDNQWIAVPATAELTLNPGDILFIPRGLYHSAKTSSCPSVHMTVGVFSPNWLDVFRDSIPALTSEEQYRMSVPRSTFTVPSAIQSKVRNDMNLGLGLQLTKDRVFNRHIDSRVDRLADLLCLGSRKFTALERQDVPFALSHDAKTTRLRFCGKELEFPVLVRELIEFICTHQGLFRTESLPPVIDFESLDPFLAHLIQEGFLRTICSNKDGLFE